MKKAQFRMFRCVLPGVEAVVADSTHSFPRHTHDQFGIGVIQRGAQKSLSGRGIVEAGAGDVITVNPGEVHDGHPIGEAGRAWRMLYINPEVLGAQVQDINDQCHVGFEFTDPVMQNRGTSEDFVHLFNAVTDHEILASSLRCEEMLLLLFRHLVAKPVERSATQSARIIRLARDRIEDMPGEAMTLQELADLCGLSRFQLLRSFIKATGFTPHAYVLQQRIAMARRLIAGRMPLAEAATASGFADQSHMTRLFARQFGVTPGAYAAAVA